MIYTCREYGYVLIYLDFWNQYQNLDIDIDCCCINISFHTHFVYLILIPADPNRDVAAIASEPYFTAVSMKMAAPVSASVSSIFDRVYVDSHWLTCVRIHYGQNYASFRVYTC